ncbi:hypothetical protein [Superficieibacter sp. HKU1]|uniref:hypothetical protein n=1 Tax=Superficieibacter sp. HKU1 TaxID=3031919 RepID=UPI0023E1F874|nr:hypothetical protein [Superficieibacter sp. HKU1]WES67631.1 hypothetical protein P0H77_18780 [Superficieibacter sp. HKU1]
MKIINFITGKNISSLIYYFDSINENDIIEHALNNIWLKQKIPNPLSVIAIMMLLMFSFSVPFQITLVSFDFPPPVAVSIIYPPVLIVVVLVVLAMKATIKGRKWAVVTFKYLFLIDCLLFLISLYLSFYVGDFHWQLMMVIAGMLLWSRYLLNSHSFLIVIKFYLHRRLAMNVIDKVSDKKNTHQGK